MMHIEIDEDQFNDDPLKEIITVVHAHGDLGDLEPHAVIVEIDRNFIVRDKKIPDQFINSFDF
jgi:hypothetical protein